MLYVFFVQTEWLTLPLKYIQYFLFFCKCCCGEDVFFIFVVEVTEMVSILLSMSRFVALDVARSLAHMVGLLLRNVDCFSMFWLLLAPSLYFFISFRTSDTRSPDIHSPSPIDISNNKHNQSIWMSHNEGIRSNMEIIRDYLKNGWDFGWGFHNRYRVLSE